MFTVNYLGAYLSLNKESAHWEFWLTFNALAATHFVWHSSIWSPEWPKNYCHFIEKYCHILLGAYLSQHITVVKMI